MPERPTRIATRPDLPPWEIEWHAELDSTMDRARELALAGAPGGTVVVADYQRQGRGTRGRRWDAPPGTCLMFTFLLRGSFDAGLLADLPGRVAGLARDAVRRHYDIAVDVSPPNDLMVGCRKLAGVLCLSQMTGETSPWALCGVGMNTNLDVDEIVVANSTSLLIEGAGRVCHAELLGALLGEFDVLRSG